MVCPGALLPALPAPLLDNMPTMPACVSLPQPLLPPFWGWGGDGCPAFLSQHTGGYWQTCVACPCRIESWCWEGGRGVPPEPLACSLCDHVHQGSVESPQDCGLTLMTLGSEVLGRDTSPDCESSAWLWPLLPEPLCPSVSCLGCYFGDSGWGEVGSHMKCGLLSRQAATC